MKPPIRVLVEVTAFEVPGLFATDRTWASERVIVPAEQIEDVDFDAIVARVTSNAEKFSETARLGGGTE